MHPRTPWKKESVTFISFIIINVCFGSNVHQEELVPQGKVFFNRVREVPNQEEKGRKSTLNRSMLVFYLLLLFGAVNEFSEKSRESGSLLYKAILDFVLG